MKKTLTSAKRFVANHRTGIAVTGTALAATYIHCRVIHNYNERLTEMGIDLDEFYTTEEEVA